MPSASPSDTSHGVPQWLDACFGRDPTPRLVLDSDGVILAANMAASRLIETQVLSAPSGRLRFGSPESNAFLSKAIKRLAGGGDGEERVLVRDFDGAWRSAFIYTAADCEQVFVTLGPAAESLPSAGIEAVTEAFGLSRAEAQVFANVMAGDCPKDTARKLSLSEHTVRSHLRAIYGKLGVRGLTGAVRLSIRLAA